MTSPRFINACRFAALKHATQQRKASNSKVVPYLVHPLEASQLLAECGITDEDVLIAAVLHDILEDTDATKDDILFKFGTRVLSIVEECTDDPALTRVEQKQMQIMNSQYKTYAAKLVKAADKTSNMRDISRLTPPSWSLQKTSDYVFHARKVVQGLNETGELPSQLVSWFWEATEDVLHQCNEKESANANMV